MQSRVCPVCGKPFRGSGCPRCAERRASGSQAAGRRKPSRRTAGAERGRKAANPWRASYSTAEWRRARQEAVARAGGRCEACGRPIAEPRGGKWFLVGGSVHHVVPLSAGGTNAPGNLAALCHACHNRADAERRRLEREGVLPQGGTPANKTRKGVSGSQGKTPHI